MLKSQIINSSHQLGGRLTGPLCRMRIDIRLILISVINNLVLSMLHSTGLESLQVVIVLAVGCSHDMDHSHSKHRVILYY